ncbi:MAG TPA: PAS domain S-box protein, partial [Gemmatimonadales bacterium]|nr:PAS domain S-box protein [Gemmatimonadales bacterium]
MLQNGAARPMLPNGPPVTQRRSPRRKSMDRAARAAFLDSILQSSTEYSLIAMDLDGRIIAWNEGARRIYGYEESEVTGKSAFLLSDPDDVRSGRALQVLATVRDAGAWSGEVKRRRKDGSSFIAFVTLTLRHDVKGRPEGFTLISRDISEAKRLTE